MHRLLVTDSSMPRHKNRVSFVKGRAKTQHPALMSAHGKDSALTGTPLDVESLYFFRHLGCSIAY
jgi:hypothetical protein